jgi:SepF-like predicted cell division protein (DUF552 family)
MLSESEVLDDTDIDFYGGPEVRFHINSGRNWESKTTVSVDEEGNETTKQTINTTPCPTVDVYDMDDTLEVVVHLPTGNPVIIDWFTVESDYDEFFNRFIQGLEEGYEGIKEVTSFEVSNSSYELGSMVRDNIKENVPENIEIPVIKVDPSDVTYSS